jgi:hypothetical protein
MRKDALCRSANLIQQAEDSGYFLSQEQCVAKLIDANNKSPNSNNQSTTTPGDQLDASDHNTTSSIGCCWSKILSQQSDFLKERPLLQAIIEDSGHICLFLPKFHCELNPIELFWSYIKECEFFIEANQAFI